MAASRIANTLINKIIQNNHDKMVSRSHEIQEIFNEWINCDSDTYVKRTDEDRSVDYNEMFQFFIYKRDGILPEILDNIIATAIREGYEVLDQDRRVTITNDHLYMSWIHYCSKYGIKHDSCLQ